MYAEIATIIAPVFICAAIGFGWARSGQPFDSHLVSTLVMNIGAPCLIVGTLGKVDMPADHFSQILLATVLVLALTGLLATLLCAIFGLSFRAFITPLCFPNSGNMGLPLSMFAFGDEGLAVALGVFLVMSCTHFSLGLALVSGRGSLQTVLRSPIVYAALIAMGLVYSEQQLPGWIQNTTDLLGGLSIPLMLITLGVSLQRLRVSDVAVSLGLAVARLVIGLSVGLLVVEILALEGVVAAVIIMQSAMPAAVFNYLLAHRYERQPEAVAGMVVLSTLLSIVWLPFVLGIVLP